MKIHPIILSLILLLACGKREPALVYQHEILELYPTVEIRPFAGFEGTISLEKRGVYYEVAKNKPYTGKLTGRWFSKKQERLVRVEYLVQEGLVTEISVYDLNGTIRHNQNAKARWVTQWYEDGKIASEHHMDKDVSRGYYSNGNLSFEYNEHYKTVYYPDGTLKERSERIAMPDGSYVLNGRHESYYENGQLMAAGIYTKGNIDGEWVSYNLDGSIKNREKYNSGLKVES